MSAVARVSVNAHRIVSVTERNVHSSSSKWAEYIFKDAKGDNILEVTVFYTNLKGDLKITRQPVEHIA